MSPLQNLLQMQILVVDDAPESLRLLAGILREQGYQVRAAPNGELALLVAQKRLPNLILLDINMPEMDGYEVCRQLKANPRTSQIPVIFLSAWSDVFDKVKAFSVGGIDYITKPFQIEEVLARIKTHLTLCALQNTLKQKNEDLSQALHQLQMTQHQLIQSEKIAALGQFVANVAHEINTPLGAIRSSAEVVYRSTQNLEPLTQVLQTMAPEQWQLVLLLLQHSAQAMPDLTKLSSREKRQQKRLLMQQLEDRAIPRAAILADTLVDIGIYKNFEPFLSLLSQPEHHPILEAVYQLVSLQKSAQTILTATDQAERIVLALKRYVHQDASGKKTVTDLIEGIETALALHHNQLRNVEVVRDYRDTPAILAFPDELTQIWSNLISNAVYAMSYQGSLTISVSQAPDYVQVDITDTGKGIVNELQTKIFEPLFTTKPKGEGSGLGLSIVKKIVDRHTGQINVASSPSQTTFSVFLPIAAPLEQP